LHGIKAKKTAARSGGNLAIFRSREAEAFVKQNPFILEGLIKSYDIRDSIVI
jgi:hypothetical protein